MPSGVVNEPADGTIPALRVALAVALSRNVVLPSDPMSLDRSTGAEVSVGRIDLAMGR